ncbi:hypothetical protein N7452_009343 [Penicillium brevicompactum]|uniref:Uncharacterized protein n=1 Tax=Penicillium brevicompactum TaxID=5074 RepID=A0A9W9UAK0_PENBR|nr:hypothetical protein N7452_009343 [Penicillium brevicompactum]
MDPFCHQVMSNYADLDQQLCLLLSQSGRLLLPHISVTNYRPASYPTAANSRLQASVKQDRTFDTPHPSIFSFSRHLTVTSAAKTQTTSAEPDTELTMLPEERKTVAVQIQLSCEDCDFDGSLVEEALLPNKFGIFVNTTLSRPKETDPIPKSKGGWTHQAPNQR